MRNFLWFAFLGALIFVTVTGEFEELKGEEDALMSDEEFDGSGIGPSFLQCKKDAWKCIKSATSWKERLACRKPYFECLKNSLPTTPPHVKKCRMEKRRCLAVASGLRERWRCFKGFVKCAWRNRPQ